MKDNLRISWMNSEARHGRQGIVIEDLVLITSRAKDSELADADLKKVVGGGYAEYQQCIEAYKRAEKAAGPGGWGALPAEMLCEYTSLS